MRASSAQARILPAMLVVVVVSLPGHAQETGSAEEAQTRPPRAKKDTGYHVTLTLSGSELEAPRQSPTTDLELFTGLGLALAGGYRFDRFRFEGELHLQRSERGFTSDSVESRSLMLNAYVDLPISERFAFFLGAGLGTVDVDVQIDTCLDLVGCPGLAFVDASKSATAYQYMVGFGWSPTPRRQLFVGYREFASDDLGLMDSEGNVFADDRVDMPTALLGYTWKFEGRGRGKP